MSGFTPGEIKAHQSDLEGIAGWSEEGLRWHEYLLSFAARWGQQPISSQAPLNFIDTLLKRQEADLNAANQLLEQTIEVLEEVQRISLWALDGVSSYLQSGAQKCLVQSTKAYVDQTRNEIRNHAKPLLDKLQALKKEGTDG